MASVGQGIALGAAAASFRKADERAVQREATTSRAQTATLDRQARSDLADRLISEKERKDILENTRASHQILLTERRRLKNLRASLDPNDPNDAAAIHKIQSNLAALDKQLVTVANAIGPGEKGNSILSNPAAFAALGAADQSSQEFNPTPRVVAAAAGQATGTAAAAAAPGEATAAQTIEAGKLKARADFMQTILQEAGLSPEDSTVVTNDPVTVGAIQAPVEGGGPVSEDLGTVAQHLTLSRALFAAKLIPEANFELAQARFVMENSPSIQRDQDLDKPLGKEMLQVTGLQPGATMRDAMELGKSLPTGQEQARARAVGTAEGKASVDARGKIALIEQTQGIIRGLLDEFQGKGKFTAKGPNPNLFGIRGSFARTGKAALAVLSDIGLSNFVEEVTDLAITGTDLTLDQLFQMTESPTLSVLDILENTIGIVWANVRTKTGRVPLELIRKSIKEIELTSLGKGGQQVADRLELVFNLIGGRAKTMRNVSGLGGGEQSGIPRFRVEGGKLVPVQ